MVYWLVGRDLEVTSSNLGLGYLLDNFSLLFVLRFSFLLRNNKNNKKH